MCEWYINCNLNYKIYLQFYKEIWLIDQSVNWEGKIKVKTLFYEFNRNIYGQNLCYRKQ